MDAERPDGEFEWREPLEELSSRVAANRADIEALLARADDANHRAEASDVRADASEELATEDHRRIGDLETRADIDRELIAELQADGLLNREHAEQLGSALHSSRMIGAAIGIIMANRRVNEQVAFQILARASQHANRKVRILADEVVRTGDVSDLPGA